MEDGAAQYAALLEAKSHWQRDARAVLVVAAAAKDALARSPPKRAGGGVGVGDESEAIKELGSKMQRQEDINPQPSTLNTYPSTLNPERSTLKPHPSTLNPQPQTLNMPP